MAKTLVGIVYDKRTLALRYIVVPDDDDVLSSVHGKRISSYEDMIFHSRSKGWDIAACLDAIRLHTGREPPTLEMIRAQGL